MKMWVREFLNGAGVRARDIIKFNLDFLFCVIESMKKITFNKSSYKNEENLKINN